MITEEIIHSCRGCQSTNIICNGKTKAGKQKFKCKDCGKCGTLVLSPPRYSEDQKEQILAALHERSSLAGIRRVFGPRRETVHNWLKKKSENS